MTAGLLDIPALAGASGVPSERVRHYAEIGVLPPARRDGDRFGYPPAEAATVRMAAGAEDLGLDGATLTGLAAAWREGGCATARQRLAAAVTARLGVVQAGVAQGQRQMAEAGMGTGDWAAATESSVSLFEEAARLQAVADALAAASHTGGCGDTCGCAAALAAPATVYRFPSAPGAGDAALSCGLAADDGDVHHRIGSWQEVLGRVHRREALPGTGVVLWFPFEVEIAALLGRLAAAEYRCCSFGSYTIVIDGAGLRLEIRMPLEAADTMAAVLGTPVGTAGHSDGETA